MNIDLLKKDIINQLEASLSMLKQCIDNCPKEEWNKTQGDYPFSQVLFHVLFYTDFYLSRNETDFLEQDFHKNNKEMFKDYEELKNQLAVHVYTINEIQKYFDYCRSKIYTSVEKETEESLEGGSGFYHKIRRLELFFDLIRHLQHHTAQLGLRIQLLTKIELKWVTSGWKEFKKEDKI